MIRLHALLLATDLAPQLIQFEAGDTQARHLAIVQSGASKADLRGEIANSATIDAGDAGDSVDAKAAAEGGDDFNLLVASTSRTRIMKEAAN